MSDGVVLSVGAEGGALTIVRILDGTKEKGFDVQIREMPYEMDGTSPRMLGHATTIAGALDLLSRYPWHRFWPSLVADDAIADVEAIILARGGSDGLAEWRKRLAER